MDISKIDLWATSGESMMHGATVFSKLIATAFVVGCVVVTGRLDVLVCLYALVLVTALVSRLPVLKIFAISLFPGLFAVLFALSQTGEGWYLPAVIIMKALTAASAMVLLVSTTPYIDVIAFLGRGLPRVVADGLFMTYRSFFTLIGLMADFVTALKLRGGFRPTSLVKNAGHLASGLGMLFIRAYEKSQRLYDVMALRGYNGRLSGSRPGVRLDIAGMPYLIASASFFALALDFRFLGCPGRPYTLPALLLFYFLVMEALSVWKKRLQKR